MSGISPQRPPPARSRDHDSDEDDDDDAPIGPSMPVTTIRPINDADVVVGPQRLPGAIGPQKPPSIGPARPPSNTGPLKPVIGPLKPSAIGPERPGAIGSERPHAIGPERSLSIGAERPPVVSGPQRPPILGPQRPQLGPQRPPSAQGPPAGPYPNSESSSSSDDDMVGPRPPSPRTLARLADPNYAQREAETAFAAREQARADADRVAAELAARGPQRGEWMLVPPTADSAPVGLPMGVGKRAFSARDSTPKEIDKTWTETPAERAVRIEREAAMEALGEQAAGVPPRKKKSSKQRAEDERASMSDRDRAVAAAVQEYTVRFPFYFLSK
ncbi:hypothetical protein BC828DRAFT_378868 [Blastocladiella britannica]|nr:hypothetical protein BC828DRAFT_378868 [Blastocladiella britannica]